MKFRVKDGTHFDIATNTTYKKGALVESDDDLCAMFVNKFDRIYDEQLAHAPAAVQAAAMAGAAELAPAAPAAPVVATQPSPPAASKLGADVTADFPAAVEEDLLVLKKGSKYFVAKPDEQDKQLNDEPLTKSEVGPFIAKLG